MRVPPGRRSSLRCCRRRGFSLLELLVAVILIDVALLAIVQTSAFVVRRRNETRARADAVRAAGARVERLMTAPCAPAAGSSASPARTETWSAGVVAGASHVADSVTFGVVPAHTVVLRTAAAC